MFLVDILAGIANIFAKSVSSACVWYFWDEPEADLEIM